MILPVIAAISGLFLLIPRSGVAVQVRFVERAGRIQYVPSTPSVPAGGRVEFVNETGSTHTATCLGCPWDSGDVQPDQSIVVPFRTAGTFQFSCRYHGERLGETGALTVTR